MAEFEHTLIEHYDGVGGVCRLVAICEDSQVASHPEGGTSPIVVRIRLHNTSTRPGFGKWLHSNGDEVIGTILPGENQEINITPARRLHMYLMRTSLGWGS
jgi:hypothetical protein